MKRHGKVIKVVHSCLTGRIVWVYIGSSEHGAQIAYGRACKKEVRRVRQWAARMKERRRRIMRIVRVITRSDSSSSSAFAVSKTMTPEQRKAMRELQRLCRQQPPQSSEFYEHIVEEARRRNFRSQRWKDNREKVFRYGKTTMPGEYKPKKKIINKKK